MVEAIAEGARRRGAVWSPAATRAATLAGGGVPLDSGCSPCSRPVRGGRRARRARGRAAAHPGRHGGLPRVRRRRGRRDAGRLRPAVRVRRGRCGRAAIGDPVGVLARCPGSGPRAAGRLGGAAAGRRARRGRGGRRAADLRGRRHGRAARRADRPDRLLTRRPVPRRSCSPCWSAASARCRCWPSGSASCPPRRWPCRRREAEQGFTGAGSRRLDAARERPTGHGLRRGRPHRGVAHRHAARARAAGGGGVPGAGRGGHGSPLGS